MYHWTSLENIYLLSSKEQKFVFQIKTMEDLDAVMQNMLGCLPHVSLREQNVVGTDFTLQHLHPKEHLSKSLIQFLI